MDPRTLCSASVLLVMAATLGVSRAHADEGGKASRLLQKANAQCAGNQPAEALPIYEEALKAKSLPNVHLAYGDCLRTLGKYEQAIEQYRQYLQKAKGRKSREQAESLIKLCEEEMKAAAAAEPARPTTVPADQAGGEQPPDLKPARPAPAGPPPHRRRRLPPVYFWSGVGVTAALLAAGTACGVVAIVKGNRFNDPATPYEELQDLKDVGQAMKLTSTIAFAVGGATAAATTVLFFFTRFKPAETVAAAPVPGGAMVVLGGRF